MIDPDVEAMIKDLQDQVDYLMHRRVTQADVLPDSIKQRALGEANRYILTGLEIDLPTGQLFGSSTSAFFAFDTNKLFIWNGTTWMSIQLI
jgi:acetylglutamate kinase